MRMIYSKLFPDSYLYPTALYEQRLEILGISRGGRVRTFRVAKTKELISCAVTALLICAFVFV